MRKQKCRQRKPWVMPKRHVIFATRIMQKALTALHVSRVVRHSYRMRNVTVVFKYWYSRLLSFAGIFRIFFCWNQIELILAILSDTEVAFYSCHLSCFIFITLARQLILSCLKSWLEATHRKKPVLEWLLMQYPNSLCYLLLHNRLK